MGKILRLFIVLLVHLYPSHIYPQSEKEAVIETVQLFFDGMSEQDTSVIEIVLLKEGQFFSIREDTSDIVIKRTSHTEYLQALRSQKQQRLEVMQDPLVLIHKRIAVVWTDYQFYRNGRRSHGGVDAFSLLKTEDGWKIAGIIYTIE